MGIAVASGAPPFAGIITGVIGGIIVGYLSNSNVSVSGPAVDDESETTENRNSKNGTFVENVAAINVKRTVQAIMERSTILEHMIANGEIGIIGGMHELSTGEVTFYEETSSI